MKKLVQRDMELAKKKRDQLQQQRKTEKEWAQDKVTKSLNKKKAKRTNYRNVQSKIKASVQIDKSK